MREQLRPEQAEWAATEIVSGNATAAQIAAFAVGLRTKGETAAEVTVFNFIAPLLNPAQPRAAAIGCSSAQMAPILTRVAAERGHSVIVVNGLDGLDEVTTAAPTRVWIASDGEVTADVIDTLDFGIARSRPGDLRGGDAFQNAEVVRRILAGESGAIRDAVLVNASVAIAAFRGIDGKFEDAIGSGLNEAREAVDSGSAAAVLDNWVRAATT